LIHGSCLGIGAGPPLKRPAFLCLLYLAAPSCELDWVYLTFLFVSFAFGTQVTGRGFQVPHPPTPLTFFWTLILSPD